MISSGFQTGAMKWKPSCPVLRFSGGARAQQDPGSDVPDSFDDVEAAFFRHELSAEQYDFLRRAVAEAPGAGDSSL